MSESIICFDTEMAEEQKLLELSIYNYDLQEVYHSYYNPGKVRRWMDQIHHITADVVADAPRFTSERKRVQAIIDGADYIVGCALRNDTDAMTRAGVKFPDRIRQIEIQQWFWLLHGSKEGESMYQTHSLMTIAKRMGVAFSEDEAHGASADTRATMECFIALKKELDATSPTDLPRTVTESVALFDEQFPIARTAFLREDAKGVAQLLQHDGFYTMKFNRQVVHPHPKCVKMIEVNDRFIAEIELRKLYKRREFAGNECAYRLSEKDIKKFEKYRNEFDEERSALCKRFITNKSPR